MDNNLEIFCFWFIYFCLHFVDWFSENVIACLKKKLKEVYANS